MREAIGNVQHAQRISRYNAYLHICLAVCRPTFHFLTPSSSSHLPLYFVDSLDVWICLDCFFICWVPQYGCRHCKQRQEQVLWVVSRYCSCQCCPHACIVFQHVETAGSYYFSLSYDLSLSPSLDFFLCLSPSLSPSLVTLSPSRFSSPALALALSLLRALTLSPLSRVRARSISLTLSHSEAFLSPSPSLSPSPLWHSLCTHLLTEGASGSSTRC